MNSGCGCTFHDHATLSPDPLSILTSSMEASHDALEMTQDWRKNPLALKELTSMELDDSTPPSPLALEPGERLIVIKHEAHVSIFLAAA